MDKILNDLIPGTKDWSCQFKLQRKKIAENNSYGFVSLYLSEYVLLYDKHLPMHNLYSSDGEMIGVLIGTVIDNENNVDYYFWKPFYYNNQPNDSNARFNKQFKPFIRLMSSHNLILSFSQNYDRWKEI
mgnify:CR=1 FL=1